MGWEVRKGKWYYYTSVRAGDGQVRKRYLGVGDLAAKAAADLEARRQARETDRAAVAAEVERLAEADALTAEVVAAAAVLADALLLATGWHRLHHGPWRRKRGNG